jgi:hypothetical protein
MEMFNLFTHFSELFMNTVDLIMKLYQDCINCTIRS